jgi:hypothetical protein
MGQLPVCAQKSLSKTKHPSVLESWIFLSIQIVLAILDAYWWHHLPPVGYAVTVLAGAAAAMSLNEHMNRWKKGFWFVLLVVLVRIELKAINKDRVEQSNHLVETLNIITGGDSFAFLSLRPMAEDSGIPFLVQVGNNPLRSVRIQIVRQDDPTHVFGIYELPTRDLAKDERTQLLGYKVNLSNQQSAAFLIYYDALNGHWSQRISLRKMNDQWLEATYVRRELKTGETDRIYERIDPGFPMINGEPDWVKPGSK